MEISKGLSDMVGGNVENLFGTILLVVSKVPADDDPQDFQERMNNLLKSMDKVEQKSVAFLFKNILK